MSTHINCLFYRSEEPDVFWIVKPHKGTFNPDKHAYMFKYSECTFGWTRRNGQKLYKITHTPTGDVYYGIFDE